MGGMVLWLVATAATLRGSQANSPGTLFGRPVPLHEYLKSAEAVTHEAILRYGDQYRHQVPDSQLKQQAWERLVLVTEARREKIRISDSEVIEEIQRHPVFRSASGQFDSRGYQAIIQYSLGTTPRVFEEETREDLAIRKLLQKAVGNPTLTDEEIRTGFLAREESIRIRFLKVPKQALAREISDACRQTPAQLDEIARQLRLPVKKSDFFKRNSSVPEFGPAEAMLEPVFNLKPGEISPALPTPKGWVVAQLLERQKADESKLAAVREELKKELLDRKRLKSYLTWYQGLLKRASPKSS